MTYIIRHREVLEQTYAIEASSKEDAAKKFSDASNDGKIDYSDIEMVESENEVIGIHHPLYSTLIEGAIPVYDDDSNGDDDKKTKKKREFNHINDCWDAVRECKTRDELEGLFEEFPRWSGNWYVDFNHGYCSVINSYWDKQSESQEEEREDVDIPWCPECVEIPFSTLKENGAEDNEFDDEDRISDIVSDYLSDKFGFCHNGFDLAIEKDKELVIASNISWDYDDGCGEEDESD